MIDSPEFQQADFDTGFVERFGPLASHTDPAEQVRAARLAAVAAALTAHLEREKSAVHPVQGDADTAPADGRQWRAVGRRLAFHV